MPLRVYTRHDLERAHGSHVTLVDANKKATKVVVTKACGGHGNTGRSPPIHPCEGRVVLDFSEPPGGCFYVGTIMAKIDEDSVNAGSNGGQFIECQYITSLEHVAATGTEEEGHTVAKGKGFDPNGTNGQLVDVTIFTPDRERYIFTLLKIMFCYLAIGQKRRKKTGSSAPIVEIRTLISDDELLADFVYPK